MLKSSRTWPSIIQKTMAVVQLKFDGKYAYSTIANINQLQKLQNQISDTSCDREDDLPDDNENSFECACDSKDLQSKCGSYTMSCSHMTGRAAAASRSLFSSEKNRRRSESIKVDNWDYIYREKPFLNVPNSGERNAIPK